MSWYPDLRNLPPRESWWSLSWRTRRWTCWSRPRPVPTFGPRTGRWACRCRSSCCPLPVVCSCYCSLHKHGLAKYFWRVRDQNLLLGKTKGALVQWLRSVTIKRSRVQIPVEDTWWNIFPINLMHTLVSNDRRVNEMVLSQMYFLLLPTAYQSTTDSQGFYSPSFSPTKPRKM